MTGEQTPSPESRRESNRDGFGVNNVLRRKADKRDGSPAYFEENLTDRLMVTCSRLKMLLMTQPKVDHAGSTPHLIVAYHLSAPYAPREGDCDQ